MNRRVGVTNVGVILAAVIGVGALGGWMPHPPHSDQAAPDSVVIVVHEGTRLGFDLSRDGRTIVFDLLGQLWLVSAEGGTAVPLTNAVRDSSEDFAPAFSADRRSVAFRADRPGGAGLFIVSRDGGPVRRLTTEPWAPSVQRPVWSADGRYLAPTRSIARQGRLELQMLDVATGAQRAVVVDSLPWSNPWLALSRDGARLILSAPADASAPREGRLFEVPTAGGVARVLTGDPHGRAPEPAPDGRRVAFFARDSSARYQLSVVDSAGVIRQITSQADVTPLGARWTPDGNALVYHADGKLWLVPAAGGRPREVPFTVRLAIPRRAVRATGQRFAAPGSAVRAHGFGGLALSPSGRWTGGLPARPMPSRLSRTRPNESRLSCGRRTGGRTARPLLLPYSAGEQTQQFPTWPRPTAAGAS